MSHGGSDARVMQIAYRSGFWRASSAVVMAFAAAWSRSASGRAVAAIVASGAPPRYRLQARAALVGVAAVSASLFSFAGTRHDGVTWIVPAVVAVAAAAVLMAALTAKDHSHRE